MKKTYKIAGLALLILIALATVFILYHYAVPDPLKKYYVHSAKELGYVPDELLVQLKPGTFYLNDPTSIKAFEEFLRTKSKELTPIILNKLKENGELKDVSSINVKNLETNLIRFKRMVGSQYGAVLTLAIYDSVLEISEELKKDSNFEQVSPNSTFDFSKDLKGEPIPGTPN